MDNPQRRTKNYNGGDTGPRYRLLLLSLGLLNVALLICAVVIGIMCAQIRQNSLHVSHPVAAQLLNQLHDLHNNHSDVIMAEEDAKRALETAVKNHAMLKDQLQQKQIINDGYQKQLEALRTERTTLLSNISALEMSCGKCPPGFLHFNTSCYFFSYAESSTVKKNWHNSRTDCINRGSDLIVIDSPEEQTFVGNSVKKMVQGLNVWQNGFWVGLTDMDTEDHWVWINNVTEVEPRYWMDGEPNEYGIGEDCAAVVYSSSNPWKSRNDANCQRNELYWICEKVSR
ncbi:CD209 antigen-like protein C isoform X2 [Salarias fasciatus]|nr:CD209 antigen-like protein C isoform X2 [Salarias fasciatus]